MIVVSKSNVTVAKITPFFSYLCIWCSKLRQKGEDENELLGAS